MSTPDALDIGGLYKSERDALAGYLARLCGDAELAAELVQEAFLAARRYAHTYKPELGGQKTWIYAIARNAFKRHLRRTAGKTPEALEVDVADDRSAAGGETERWLVIEEVRAAVERLPEPERSIIRLKYFENATLKQCADRLGLSASTTARRLADALKLLRRELQSGGSSAPS